MTTRVLQMDLALAPSDIGGLSGYDSARVLLRYGRRVVSEVSVPIEDGVVTRAAVTAALNEDRAARARLSERIVEEHLIRPVLRRRGRSSFARATVPSCFVVASSR